MLGSQSGNVVCSSAVQGGLETKTILGVIRGLSPHSCHFPQAERPSTSHQWEETRELSCCCKHRAPPGTEAPAAEGATPLNNCFRFQGVRVPCSSGLVPSFGSLSWVAGRLLAWAVAP